MKKTTMYVSIDGKKFKSEEECRAHEASLRESLDENFKDAIKFMSPGLCCYATGSNETGRVFSFICHKGWRKEVELLTDLSSEYDFICPDKMVNGRIYLLFDLGWQGVVVDPQNLIGYLKSDIEQLESLVSSKGVEGN